MHFFIRILPFKTRFWAFRRSKTFAAGAGAVVVAAGVVWPLFFGFFIAFQIFLAVFVEVKTRSRGPEVAGPPCFASPNAFFS